MLNPNFVNGGLYLLRLISCIVLYYVNINFNWVIKGHSKFVSEVYLSNVSLDKDQIPHNLQPGLENNLRDCLQPKWKDFFKSEETILHPDKRKILEVDSLPKILDLIHDNL